MDPNKEKAYNEELARLEAREVFEKSSDNRRSKVWHFLNSSFGLFVLSTIVIGGLSWFYKEWKENQDEDQQEKIQQREDTRTLTRLTEETLVRLTVIEGLDDTIPEYKSKNVLLAFWGSSIRGDKSLNLKYYHLRPLFIEYEKWTLIELLTELSKFADKTVEKDILDTKNVILEDTDNIYGGQFVYAITKDGEKLPPGTLVKPEQSRYENRKYLTNENRVVEISRVKNGSMLPPGRLLKPQKLPPQPWLYETSAETINLPENKIPITKYYTVGLNQTELLQSIKKLKRALADNIKQGKGTEVK